MVSAFSVPKAKRQQKTTSNPGPGQYNPETSPKVSKPTDPNYSFGKDVRRHDVSPVPGPGSYEQKKSFVKQSTPSYSLQAKREQKLNANQVGPGQYQPSDHYAKTKQPSYSLYGRSNSQMKGLKLGPGQYQIKSQFEHKKQLGVFSKDAKDQTYKSIAPGPGAYDYENAVFKYGSTQDPSYGFGSRIKELGTLNVPGPGTYDKKSGQFSKIGGIMSRQLRNSYVQSKTPGPGNYEGDSIKVKSKDPSYSLPKGSRDDMSKSTLVGPGAYDADKNYKSLATTNRGYRLGSQIRLKHEVNNVPGPGTYEKSKQKGKQITMGSKLNSSQTMAVPGPGSYENQKYDYQSWLKGSGRYSLGKSARDDFNSSKVPGPGTYDSSIKLKDPNGKVTFGRDSKLKYEKSLNPGPGHYDLKPTFADVPHYLLPNKST